MKKILKVDNPNVYAAYVGAPVLHPKLALISYDEVSPFRNSLNDYGVFGLFIQQQFPKYLSYGTKSILVGDSSVIAVAPGQIGGGEDNGTPLYINGWALLWASELLKGSPLEGRMDNYPFFSYFDTDWLRMTPVEYERISSILVMMRKEMQENADSPGLRRVLTSYLQLILDYCQRIYLRQVSQKENGESDILKRFHRLLVDYFSKGLQHTKGLPSVAWCASELAYSPRYFGDMIHQATGGTAIGYIHNFVIDQAKTFLMKGLTVGEVADLLGFAYPHHFSRLFKTRTGCTPSEYLKK
ncbi:MAG: AraC family transcriptional regulator [Bacteroidales bacterium]|nr:AraC family transcriptional regulator [Bacteroidales bacterium]